MIWSRNYDAHVAAEGGYEIEVTENYATGRQRKVPPAEKYLLELRGTWVLYRTFPTITKAKQAAERVLAALKEEE